MAKKTRKLALRTETLRRLQVRHDDLARVVGGTYIAVQPYVPDYPDDYDEFKYRLTGYSLDSRCG
jgi:hypothetical protein